MGIELCISLYVIVHRGILCLPAAVSQPYPDPTQPPTPIPPPTTLQYALPCQVSCNCLFTYFPISLLFTPYFSISLCVMRTARHGIDHHIWTHRWHTKLLCPNSHALHQVTSSLWVKSSVCTSACEAATEPIPAPAELSTGRPLL